MEEPDVRIRITVQSIIQLESLKKAFPFGTKSQGEITPKSLNTDIVNTPKLAGKQLLERDLKVIHTDPIYRNLAQFPSIFP